MKTLKMWIKFMGAELKRMIEYRDDFVIGIIAMILANAMTVIFFWVILQNTASINGWTINEMLFLLGVDVVAWGIWNTFLKGSAPWRIGTHIRQGTLDRVMVQPVKPLKYLVISVFDSDGLGELISGFAILFYAMTHVGIIWGLQNLLLLSIFILSGSIILFSIFLVLSTLSFWATETGAVVDIMWTVGRFTEYPLEIYNASVRVFMTFILPIAFINYFPVSALLHKGIWPQLQYLSPLVAIISFAIAYSFWNFGLKDYSSTGS